MLIGEPVRQVAVSNAVCDYVAPLPSAGIVGLSSLPPLKVLR